MKVIRRKQNLDAQGEGDMTSMIDMVFQLVAFFMVAVNFSEVDQDQIIKLPYSNLVKPSEDARESILTLQVKDDGNVILGGETVAMEGVERKLRLEVQAILSKQQKPDETIVIIRADKRTKHGKVQDLIQICQQVKFQHFALRASPERPRT
jgi:biopolymer transport protein ExbD